MGTKLKAIDNQFQEVSNEYASIHDSIERLEGEVGEIGKEVEEIRSSQGSLTDRIRQVVREELPAMQDRWLIATGSLVVVLLGIVISVPQLQGRQGSPSTAWRVVRTDISHRGNGRLLVGSPTEKTRKRIGR